MFLLKRNNMEENTDGLNTNEVSTIEVYEFVGTDATNSGSDYTGSNYTGSDYTGSDYTGDCARRYTCRICLEEEDDDSTLVAPCKCAGSIKYVHASCLLRYRQLFPHMHVHRVRCAICKSDYTEEVHGFRNEAFPLEVGLPEPPDRNPSQSLLYPLYHAAAFLISMAWIVITQTAFPWLRYECRAQQPVCFLSWMGFAHMLVNAGVYSVRHESCLTFVFCTATGYFMLFTPLF